MAAPTDSAIADNEMMTTTMIDGRCLSYWASVETGSKPVAWKPKHVCGFRLALTVLMSLLCLCACRLHSVVFRACIPESNVLHMFSQMRLLMLSLLKECLSTNTLGQSLKCPARNIRMAFETVHSPTLQAQSLNPVPRASEP